MDGRMGENGWAEGVTISFKWKVFLKVLKFFCASAKKVDGIVWEVKVE